jgi:hypothetical protein
LRPPRAKRHLPAAEELCAAPVFVVRFAFDRLGAS